MRFFKAVAATTLLSLFLGEANIALAKDSNNTLLWVGLTAGSIFACVCCLLLCCVCLSLKKSVSLSYPIKTAATDSNNSVDANNSVALRNI